MRAAAVVFVACALFSCCAHAFYLPGAAPHSYEEGDSMTLLVNKLDSPDSVFPYDYYQFDFCQDTGEHAHNVPENLGQVVFGERIHPGPHHIEMLKTKSCDVLCTRSYSSKSPGDKAKVAALRHVIEKEYLIHWILDNMPVAMRVRTSNQRTYSKLGFPVGVVAGKGYLKQTGMKDGRYYLFNHVNLLIRYHKEPGVKGALVVGVEVTPRSIAHKKEANGDISCNTPEPLELKIPKQGELTFEYTYDVHFQASKEHWATRWDAYLSVRNPKIHWFSIINSMIIVMFLTGMVAMIILRTLHKDIARYNQTDVEDAQEEFGWKLVHGDVFRPPSKGMLLAVLVGSGGQILCMALVTLLFACIGFLSPANRGQLMTAVLVLYVCLGTPAGFLSARLYKMFGGERWKTNVLLTSLLVPGVIFCLFFILNLVLFSKGSSAAVPFTTMLALVFMWFGISVPLCFLGAYLGFRKPAIENPVRTNQIPRQIPEQVCYLRPLPAILMGGILPFGAIFIELFFILASIWFHQLYYVFGFLFLVVCILALTCAEVTILMCYFHLCAEDYHWWWRAFLTPASTALYFFLYSIFYYFTKMDHMHGVSNAIMYFGYTLVMCIVFAIGCGCIGFYACFFFVRKIYSSVKVD